MTMKIIRQNDALHVVGIELRTSNLEARQTIPQHWERFIAGHVLSSITERLSDDVYAVYTNFQNAGVDNRGTYSCVIGPAIAASSTAKVPAGMIRVCVPVSTRAVFPVLAAHPEKVPEVWQEVWSRNELAKTYIADYERYCSDGRMSISIGIEHPRTEP